MPLLGSGLIKRRASGALLTNLISFWSLEEASGQRNDSRGTNHLSDNASVGQTTGKVGNAAQFVGASSQYLDVADNASLSVAGTSFSFAFWTNLVSPTTAQYMIAKWGIAGTTEFRITTDAALSGKLRITLVSSGGTETTLLSGSALSGSIWYFIVCWLDTTAQTINIQINNGAVASTAYTNDVRDGTSKLTFGRNEGGATQHANGALDQAGFWKRVLTTDERTWLYNAGNGRSYAEIVAF